MNKMSAHEGQGGSDAAAAAAAAKKLNLEKATNFMRQYRDPESRELKKLSANQFTEVWSHYDKDGKFLTLLIYAIINIIYKLNISNCCFLSDGRGT